jgi:hypothetical protein
MFNGLICVLFLFHTAGSGGDDPNPAVNRLETGMLHISLTNSYPRYVHTKSRFYGWDSAVNRNLTEGYDAYDYGPHLIYDQANQVYRMITGGRWRDCSTTNGITHDGDHSVPYAAQPVNASAAASNFRGRLSFASGAVERFSGMTMPGPCYTWANAVTTAENLAGRARRDSNTWFVANTLEPEFFRFFDRFYMIDQVNVMEGDRLDYWRPGFEFATAKADRLQLHTAPVTNGFNFSRVLVPNPGFTNQWSSHRGIVTNIEFPELTKLTHQMVIVVPDDPDGKIFWLYAASFITNDYKGYSLMRSAEISTFNWGEREAVSGVPELGNQVGYINLDDGRRLYVMIGETSLVDGRKGTLLKFSADGRAFTFCNSVRIDMGDHAASTTGSVSLAMSSLTNNPNNRNHFFNGLCTIDGWGEIEPLDNNTFRAYYASTTANAPVSPEIFKAEIGLGEVIFQLSDNLAGFDWSGTDTDVDNDGIPNLADRDADNDGAKNDWEKFTGRNPYDFTD